MHHRDIQRIDTDSERSFSDVDADSQSSLVELTCQLSVYYPTNSLPSNFEDTEQQIEYDNLKRQGLFYGPPKGLTISFKNFGERDGFDTLVGVASNEFMYATSGVRKKRFESASSVNLIHKELTIKYGSLDKALQCPEISGSNSGYKALFDNHSTSNSSRSLIEEPKELIIPIWLFPLFWNVAISERVTFITTEKCIQSQCFQVLQLFRQKGYDVGKSLERLNIICLALTPRIMPSAIRFHENKESLVFLLGEQKMEIKMYPCSIDLNKGRKPSRPDRIFGIYSFRLFKCIQQYLLPDISKNIKLFDIDDLEESEESYEIETKATNAIYSIGKQLISMVLATQFFIRKTIHRTREENAYNDAVSAQDLSDEDDSSSKDKNSVGGNMDNSNQEHSYDHASELTQTVEEVDVSNNKICTVGAYKEGLGLKRLISDTDSIDFRLAKKPKLLLKHRSTANESSDGYSGTNEDSPLSIDDLFPHLERSNSVEKTQRSSRACTSLQYSTKKRDHVKRVVPLWIIPLVTEYLTIPEFRNNLPSISILRMCERIQLCDQHNTNAIKAKEGFKFAESCLNMRYLECFSKFNEVERLKKMWANDS